MSFIRKLRTGWRLSLKNKGWQITGVHSGCEFMHFCLLNVSIRRSEIQQYSFFEFNDLVVLTSCWENCVSAREQSKFNVRILDQFERIIINMYY